MTILPTISTSQAQKEVVANQNFEVTAPPAIFGKSFTTTTALTWGYYGGYWPVDGVLTSIADGTLTLTGSTTNYVEVDRSGTVSLNTTGFTAGRYPLYSIVAGVSTVTSYIDYRQPEYNIFGLLSKSVAGSSNVTLTQAEAANNQYTFTGILTGSINVIVPTVKARFTVKNNTTGAFTLTVKTAAGTGVIVQQGQEATLLCDGTNVIWVAATTARLKTTTFSTTLTLDWSNADSIFVTLTDDTTITMTGAVPGQKCTLTLLQDATGGRTVTWGSEVRYGTDITSIVLTTTGSLQDKLGFIYNDDGAAKYDVVALVKGF